MSVSETECLNFDSPEISGEFWKSWAVEGFLFSPCKIKASQERTSILYFGQWEHLFFQIKGLPVLFRSVQYRAQELSDQGS